MSYNTANGSLKIQQMLTNRMNKPVHKRFSELGFVKGSFVPKVAATEAMFFRQISLNEIQIYSKIGLGIYIFVIYSEYHYMCNWRVSRCPNSSYDQFLCTRCTRFTNSGMIYSLRVCVCVCVCVADLGAGRALSFEIYK